MDLFFIWLRHCLLPSWLGLFKPQRRHQLVGKYIRDDRLENRDGQLEKEYRLKKKIVKNVWLISGATMLVNPALYVILPVALFSTFLSFSILDETS